MTTTQNRICLVGTLTMAGTPSYVMCFLWHICIGGHMIHGPYPLYQCISDFWWMACFASVLVLSARMRSKEKALFLVGSTGLIISRICLGDNSLIELPLLGAMNVYAVGYLVRPARFETNRKPGAAPNGGPAAPSGNSGVTEGPPSVS
jgi:hypothetical protein